MVLLSLYGAAIGTEEDRRRPYLLFVEEGFEGQFLSEFDSTEKCPPYSTQFSWLLDLLETLSSLAERGMAHRDVKPQNIVILNSTNRPLLFDLGLVTYLESSKLVDGESASGSPAYLSPEQACGEKLTAASDIFGFGLTAATLLRVDGFPLRARTKKDLLKKIVFGDLRPDESQMVGLPKYLQKPVQDALCAALSKEPSLRSGTKIEDSLYKAFTRAAEEEGL